jgi:arylsulfatase A-like enzyme
MTSEKVAHRGGLLPVGDDVRRWTQTVLLAALLFAAANFLACDSAPRQPSIFVFLVDTLRADHLGCYGYERDTSPVLDAFTDDAVVFHHAYTASPWTRPSVASIFTAVPPAIHGVRARAGWAEPSLTTWAERLAARGYHTQCLTANGNLERRYGLDQGFLDYEYYHEDDKPYVSSPKMEEIWELSLPDSQSQDSDAPIFSYFHTMDPHIPRTPKRQYVRPFILLDVPWKTWFDGSEEQGDRIRVDVNRYDGAIRQSDAVFGRYLKELKRRGLYENSWIIFTADHGEEFREHGRRGHGHGLWENLLRVPLVVRPPGGLQGSAGAELRKLADTQFPIHAVADLIGASEWKDWSPLGEENSAWLGLPPEILHHWLPRFPGGIPEIRRASFHIDGRSGWMVADGARKLIWNEFPTPGYLQIDLQKDPGEKHPGQDPDPDLREELRAYFQACARGLDVESIRAGTWTLRPKGEYRGAHIWPGDTSAEVKMIRHEEGTKLRWKAEAGSRLLLERDVGGGWEVAREDSSWVDLADAADLGLHVREVGQAREAAELPPPMSDELRRQLKALGYLQ